VLSTLLELAGFGAIIAATYLIGGLIPALYTTGGVLLLVGYAVEDKQAALALHRVLAPVRQRFAAARATHAARKGRRDLAKAR
jgi:hypothetical protein